MLLLCWPAGLCQNVRAPLTSDYADSAVNVQGAQCGEKASKGS